MITRSGDMVSAQIGKMGSISNLNNANFSLSDGQPFNIKNDGTQYVELQVRLNGMAEGEFVTTKFEVGWNPEIVKEVKQTSLTSLNLKYGY
ncbi:MAG: hypothetical protein AAGU18_06170 [Proteiniphilum sp.]|jgi:hypothetical protein